MDEQVRPRETVSAHERPAKRRRRVWPLLLVVLLVAVVLAWRPWAHRSGAKEAGYVAPSSVAVATARDGNMPVVLTELGTVTPLATVTVQSQISGYLLSVDFKEGQEVAAGQLLALVDPRPYEATLAQYQAQLAHDQASLDQARMDLGRYQTLGRQNSIAKQTLEDQVFTVAQDQATIKVDQAEIATERLDISYCHVRAPVAGRVGLRQVDAGNYVTSAETNGLVVITEIKPISVIFTVPEDDIQPILAKIDGGTTLTVDAYDRTDTDRIASGTLLTVDNQVDTSTGTVKLRATFPNDDEHLFPNEFVNAHLLLDTLTGVVLVPNAAIQNGPAGPFVYAVAKMTPDELRQQRARRDAARANRHGAGATRHGGATGSGAAGVRATEKVVVRNVKTGHSDGSLTVVASGLSAGDRVVTDGIDRLKDNAPVVVASATVARASHTGTPPPNGE